MMTFFHLRPPLPPEPAYDDADRCPDVDPTVRLRCTLVPHRGDPRHFYVSPGLLATGRVPDRKATR